MKSFLDQLPKQFLVLAPMDDVTDTVFRRIVAGCAPPDVFFTDFVNVDALQSAGRESAMRRLRFTDLERPLIAQIWGKSPDNFYKTAAELVDMGFDGIDINMGCPDKAVLKNQCGGALTQHPEMAKEIIEAVKKGANSQVPISVKTRLGFREFDEKWFTVLFEQELDIVSVHLRTVREMSKVPAHWDLMHNIKELRDKISPNTKLVGNGDVESRSHAMDLMAQYGIDGVMIGRGIFHDPYIFTNSETGVSPWQDTLPQAKLELYQKHIRLFSETWQEGERPIAPLNKFCKIYVQGFPGAKETRESLMQCKTLPELTAKIDKLLEDHK